MTLPDERPSVLDVYCAECEAESIKRRGRLGRVVVIEGRWGWISHDNRIGRVAAREYADPAFVSRGVLVGQLIWAADVPDLEVPARLPARCRRHGEGTVDTAAVLAATRRAARAQREVIVLALSI